MAESAFDPLLATVQAWLEPGERLIEFTTGGLQGQMFDTVIALTDKYVRLGGPAGGRKVSLNDVRYIEWKSLWARLNIGTRSPKKRLVFAVDGKEWKQRAAKLAAAWRSLDRPPSP